MYVVCPIKSSHIFVLNISVSCGLHCIPLRCVYIPTLAGFYGHRIYISVRGRVPGFGGTCVPKRRRNAPKFSSTSRLVHLVGLYTRSCVSLKWTYHLFPPKSTNPKNCRDLHRLVRHCPSIPNNSCCTWVTAKWIVTSPGGVTNEPTHVLVMIFAFYTTTWSTGKSTSKRSLMMSNTNKSL